jgi:hypothetical protein
MDVLYPYLTRVNSQPTVAAKRLISPVLKYQRMQPEPDPDKPFRVGWQQWQRQLQQLSQQQRVHWRQGGQQQGQPEAEPEFKDAKPAPAETELLATGHAVTPEQDQHTDAEGHLDIYI